MLSTENTMTSICSTSKVFTATAMMTLVDQGKVSLDDKVKDVLPKYAVQQNFPEGGPVTIRTLLTHTSGLPRDTNHSYWSGPEHHFPTEDALFESLALQETTHPVGTKIAYSNIGYSLLGLIIEKVTGVTYKNYIESHIFHPLNMSHSLVEMQPSLYGNQHVIQPLIEMESERRQVSTRLKRCNQQQAYQLQLWIWLSLQCGIFD